MPNLSIKDVPENIAEALPQRAARNHRSLQGELMAIIQEAVQPFAAAAAPASPSLPGWRRGARTIELRLAQPPGAILDRPPIVVGLQRPDCGAVPRRQYALAMRFRLSAYDAAYLWLPGALQAPLATFDAKLEAARGYLASAG